MPADSNIPVLGRIAAAIHSDPNHYADGRDYYGSPVHTALERALDDHSWPHVRKEYLLDDKGKLTVFPHKKWLDDNAKKRDLPATFFYEVIRLAQCKNIDNEIFPAQCVDYYNSEHKGRAAKIIRNHARRWFFHCYAFVLGQEIIKNDIKVDQLRSVINNSPSGNGIGKVQYDFYIDTAYQKYCRSSTELFDVDAALRFKDQGFEGFNKNPILSGPRFMTNIFGLSFSYDNANTKAKRLNMDTGVNFLNEDTLKEIKDTEQLNFEKDGCKHAAALFIFCAEAERALLEKECCSPLEKVEELIRNTQDVSNFLSRKAIMPDIQQIIDRTLEELIKVVRAERDSRATRFAASGLFSDIQAFIISGPPEDPDSIEEFGSLHVVVPNEIPSPLESVIELKFHFFDINKIEQAFHYIEAYSCDDQFGRPSDGYYFMPGSDNSLPESDYLSCTVKVGTTLDPDNKTTAHVVALLYRPDISF